MQLLSELNAREAITVIMVTHEADMAEYASRIVRFLDGRVESDAHRRKAA
jgi:putative ABC transport system ATP-binding protein